MDVMCEMEFGGKLLNLVFVVGRVLNVIRVVMRLEVFLICYYYCGYWYWYRGGFVFVFKLVEGFSKLFM